MEREKPNPRTEGSRTIQTGRKKGIREIAADFHRIPQAVEYARRLGRQHRKEKQAQEHTKDSLRDPIYDKTLDQLGRSGSASPVFEDEPSGICLTIRHYEAFAGLRERAEIQYDRLPEKIKRSRTGKEMYVALHPPAKVRTGDRMADAELVDSNGETHRLSEYLGKYVLLDFRSFGCGPCLLSLPELKAASESYRDRLTVISITSDPKDQWQTASKEHGITSTSTPWTIRPSAPGTGSTASRIR